MAGLSELVCIGHSHCGSLPEAALGVRLRVLNFWTLPEAIIRTDGQPSLRPDIARQLKAPLITLMGGGAHTVLSLAVHPRPFDFVLPEAADLPLDPQAEILPYEAVRRRLKEDVEEFFDLAEMVQALVDGPVFHVDTPLPVKRSEFMRPFMPWPDFPGRLKKVAPTWHRYRMWRLNSELSREHCRQSGLGFIAHPRECEDKDGFLREELSLDGIHGNARYGQILARRIIAVVRDGRLGDDDIAPKTKTAA